MVAMASGPVAVEKVFYASISFAEMLVLEGIAASIGNVGDAYGNALAESMIGLLKTEAVSKGSPFLQGPIKTIDDIEFAAMEWVDWFNTRRLHSTLDYFTPDEFEAVYILSIIDSPAGDVASVGAARDRHGSAPTLSTRVSQTGPLSCPAWN
ncbi:integrase core domain-containing protein [Rhodococcus qingshengii]|uniref:integrase core domain-containing protein n=1 Tax=Rhodococcus qingshengii TaxID=334542 RepID=UPI001C5F0540|nr:integrase core domain-containing protein [Rhodococcus qingshengii]MBW4818774.1 integrase core domain-containing protein [Rhodococcus qingshengii]